jgi:predicted RecA/RadA family phage recombinase
MADYVQKGDMLDYTPAAAVAAGEVVVLGVLVGVAPRPIAANSLGSVAVEGVYALPVATGSTGAQGSAINWYAASGVADATTGVAAGVLAKARLAADATVHVLLNVHSADGITGPTGPTGQVGPTGPSS